MDRLRRYGLVALGLAAVVAGGWVVRRQPATVAVAETPQPVRVPVELVAPVAHNNKEPRNAPAMRLRHGPRNVKQIALTFDDGPHPAATPRLLKILKDNNAKATFFVVGTMAKLHPELVQAEYEAGHSIANHTHQHVALPKLTSAKVQFEISQCGQVIRRLTGKAPHLFRPPGGDYNESVARIAGALGYITVWWTINTADYKTDSGAAVMKKILREVSPGDIVLMHDGPESTIRMLPSLLKTLRGKGYQFVTVDQMLQSGKGGSKRA